MVGAHSGMLLPCSRTLVSLVDTLTNSGPTQVTLRLERKTLSCLFPDFARVLFLLVETKLPLYVNVTSIFPDLLRAVMADIVLSTSNRDSFCSSIWSCWAGAPFDLQLVAEVSAHGDLLLNVEFDCLNIS